jgi:hypothetical protein
MVREFDRLERSANALRDEFGPLWLRHNKPEGLSEDEDRMARQGSMLRRLRDLAQRGALKVDDSFAHMQALGGGTDPSELEDARR